MSQEQQETERPENDPAEPTMATDAMPLAPRQAATASFWLESRWAVWAAGGLIAVAAIAAYANSFRGPFVFDDISSIPNNPTIRQLWRIGTVLSPPRGGETVSGRPVLNLSLAINYALGGTKVWGYHAVNLAIHILAALVLFGILRRTFILPVLRARFGRAATPLALAVALLWVVHPLATESVTYMVQRAQSLASLFYLLTLYCVIRGAASGAVRIFAPLRGAWHRKWGSPLQPQWYVAAVFACLLGMATKEIMVTAPLLVLLYDRIFLAGTFGQALRRRWGLYLGLAATWGLLAYLVSSTGLLVHREESGSPDVWSYARSQPGVILYYLRLCVWPHPLCIECAWPAATTWGKTLPSTVVLAALVATTVWGLIGRRRGAFLGACFFLMLAPTSSAVRLNDLACEHWMYLPLAVVLTALVLGAHRASQSLIHRGIVTPLTATIVAGVLTLGVSSLLGFLTFQRNIVYHTAVTLWEDAVAKSPRSARAHGNLGTVFGQQGRLSDAIVQLQRALEIKPDYAEAHNNFGIALAQQGTLAAAIAEYQRALQIKPDYAAAHNNLGNALAQQGKLAAAIAEYQQALQIKPDYADAHTNFANALQSQGKLAAAIAEYQQALQIKPDYAEAHNNLGITLSQQGRWAEAIAHFQEALQIQPHSAEAHGNLGTVFVQQGRLSDAIVQLQRALEINPDYVNARINLGNVLQVQGKPRAAIVQWREALRLQPGNIAVLSGMAWLLASHPDASLRDGAEAVELAQQAAKLTGNRDPAVLDTLAAAYAEGGRFSEAVRVARKARELAALQTNTALADKIAARIKLYESGEPYRDAQ